jgi:DNA-binding winged helix-turn-helix (wHTH) protein/tetratricopeptide (TPR) repeat protein
LPELGWDVLWKVSKKYEKLLIAPMFVRGNGLYQFGPFRLDAGQRVLHRDGQLVLLPPKALDTLFALVEPEGRVIEKEELLRKVWPETFVEEGSLTQNISILRKALGEGTAGQQYIQTIPKRGYRFVAPVQRIDADGETASPSPVDAAPPGIPPPPVRNHKYSFTIASAAAFVVAVGAILLWWQYARVKPLTDQDVLVLADFTNMTGDPAFDSTLRDALAYQLEQSPFLKVLDDVIVRQDLQLMRHGSQERITNELAHDICVREAEKAMLSGSIANLGRTYVIELQATNCRTGATLARQQGQAADEDHVLEALATAAQGLRAQLGESLSSIQKLAPPRDWDRVTTGSLEAFQAFNTGSALYRSGQFSEAIPFLEKATKLDPNFAFAWSFLAVAYENSGGDKARFREYGDRAFSLRDRVSAYEQLRLVSNLRGQSPGQYIENFEAWSRTYPRDALPIISLGRLYAYQGQFEQALPKYQEAYRLQSRSPIFVIDMMQMYERLDRFDDAKTVAQKAFAHGVDAPNIRRRLLAIAYAQNDPAAAAQQIQWFVGKPEEYLSLADQAAEAKWLGQARLSRELYQRAAELARQRNLTDAAAGFLKPDASWDALLGNCETARNTDALSDNILALCGSDALVQRAEEQNKHWIYDIFGNPAKIQLTRAAEEFGLGHTAKAIDLFQAAAPYERAYPFTNYLRGLAYLRLHKGAEAATEFQKILDHRGNNWGPYYPLSYVGLARAAAVSRKTAQARQAYQDFFDMWKAADSDIPVLLEAHKEYAALH